MKIVLNDKLLEFSDDELDYMYIDEGNESEVYKYGDVALKIYKPYCRKERLREEDVVRLREISTKRFLMPKDIIRDEFGKFIGYTLPFIYKYPSSTIGRISMIEFLDELDIVCCDIELLAQRGIDIEDLHIDNVLYNDKFFIGDPGSFEFKKSSLVGRIYRDNIYSLNRFVINDIFGLAKLSRPKKDIIDEMFDDYYYIGDQIREDVRPKESVVSYVKRKTR